jgi:hypothetical protein
MHPFFPATIRLRAILILVLAGFSVSVFALNPIHTSTYSAFPTGLSQGKPSLHAAAIVPNGGGALYLPLALSLALSRDIEIGGGVQTQWGNGGDAVSSLLLGVQAGLRGGNTVGLHLLVGASGGKANGLTLNYHHHGGFSRRLTTETEARMGFLDALAYGDALFAMEAQYALRALVTGPVSLQMGGILSSQTDAFNDHFALDLEPGVHVATGRKSALEGLVTLGLAGPHRESFRVCFAWIQAL